MLSRTRITQLVLAAAVVAALPATAPAAKKVTCTKVAGDTIYRDQTLRLIQSVKRSKSDPDASTVTVRFCKPGSTAKPKTLATFQNTLDGGLTVQAVARGGARHIGLELSEQTGTTDATALFVYNLTSRARTFAYSSESSYSYAITGDGGVALLEAGKVTGFDGTGEHALGTDGTALARSGNTVYWTSGGAARSATLTGEAKKEL